MEPLKTQIGPGDAQGLSELFDRLKEVRKEGRLELVLRRFDAAYSRLTPEDRLIDLWIAFEALVIPGTDRGELSFRASLRIAQLLGGSSLEKKSNFNLAKRSYTARSKVVHGRGIGSKDLLLVNETRELARQALSSWLLTKVNSAEELDDRLFK